MHCSFPSPHFSVLSFWYKFIVVCSVQRILFLNSKFCSALPVHECYQQCATCIYRHDCIMTADEDNDILTSLRVFLTWLGLLWRCLYSPRKNSVIIHFSFPVVFKAFWCCWALQWIFLCFQESTKLDLIVIYFSFFSLIMALHWQLFGPHVDISWATTKYRFHTWIQPKTFYLLDWSWNDKGGDHIRPSNCFNELSILLLSL